MGARVSEFTPLHYCATKVVDHLEYGLTSPSNSNATLRSMRHFGRSEGKSGWRRLKEAIGSVGTENKSAQWR